jgi:hypothetical protein
MQVLNKGSISFLSLKFPFHSIVFLFCVQLFGHWNLLCSINVKTICSCLTLLLIEPPINLRFVFSSFTLHIHPLCSCNSIFCLLGLTIGLLMAASLFNNLSSIIIAVWWFLSVFTKTHIYWADHWSFLFTILSLFLEVNL